MENPATWGEAQHVIAKALHDHHQMTQEGLCGLSLPTYIHQVLTAHLVEALTKERARWSDDTGKIAIDSCIRIVKGIKL